jgi:Flp pilus assembly pilin Flp
LIESFERLFADEDGVAMVEYALMVALIGAALVGIVTSVSTSIGSQFTSVSNTLSGSWTVRSIDASQYEIRTHRYYRGEAGDGDQSRVDDLGRPRGRLGRHPWAQKMEAVRPDGIGRSLRDLRGPSSQTAAKSRR